MDESKMTKAQLVEEVRSIRRRLKPTGFGGAASDPVFAELRKSEEHFRNIYDHSNDAIFVVDPKKDEILDVNAKACTMLGYSRAELLSMPMSAIHPREMARLRSFFRSVSEAGSGWTNELSCTTKSRGQLAAEISASVFDLAGRTCMIAMVRDISERDRLERENQYLRDEIRMELGSGVIIGGSVALKHVLQQVELVAPTDASVLITGESGTGKEPIARAIHENSARSHRPLIKVSCASIPRELFESEFFGHIKGAFTGALKDRLGRFQLADGGTLFLDEVGEIPLELQSKLLRVLQEGEFERVGEDVTRRVDVRIIAATNRDLKKEIKARRFRQDLYFRLSVYPLEIVPLRERVEDIPPLADHFLKQACRRLGIPKIPLKRRQVIQLQNYHWPGNVRELQNIIERTVITSRSGALQFDLPGDQDEASSQTTAQPIVSSDIESKVLTYPELKNLERKNILAALNQTNGKISGPTGAAKLLGVNPTTLASRMKAIGVQKAR